MLFLVVQEHSPQSCPLHDGQGPDSLFDGDAATIRYAVADVPGHRLTFLVDADSYEQLQDLLEPGRGRCTTTIAPVKDLLA